MKFAPIPPTGLLGEFSSTYHLCLAHVLRSDTRQLVYYKERTANLDDYVILDNGAYELGRSVPFQHVVEVAKEIGPDEIVLPDVFLDKKETILAACEGHKIFMAEPEWAAYINLMVAPQGKNLTEWLQCLDALINAMKPDVIGIPVVYEKMMGRGVLIKNVIRLLGGDSHYQPEIHLLGWDGDLYKLSCYARDFPLWIRGIDSAKPFYYSISPSPTSLNQGTPRKRPNNYFGLLESDLDVEVLQSNLDLIYSAAEGCLV
jgi:hypothetical protein